MAAQNSQLISICTEKQLICALSLKVLRYRVFCAINVLQEKFTEIMPEMLGDCFVRNRMLLYLCDAFPPLKCATTSTFSGKLKPP